MKKPISAYICLSCLLSAPTAIAAGDNSYTPGAKPDSELSPLERNAPIGDFWSPNEYLRPTNSVPPPSEENIPVPPSLEENKDQSKSTSDEIRTADPDTSIELGRVWDLWHKRVATEIYRRFDSIAKKFFHGKPLACQLSYAVTRDGRIVNIRIIQKSPDVMFNSTVLMVIGSMKGDPVLQFPAGSKRQIVEKTATFTRNYSTIDPVRPTEDAKTRMRLIQLQLKEPRK